jgi:hypothetical protein
VGEGPVGMLAVSGNRSYHHESVYRKGGNGFVMPLSYKVRHRDRHAIAEFKATLTFAKQVGPKAFADATLAATALAKELRLLAPLNVQVISVGGGPQAISAVGGVGFQRIGEDGQPLLSLMVDNDSITFATRMYDRWSSVREQVRDVMSWLIPSFAPESPSIKSFSVQYINEFMAPIAVSVDPSEVLRRDCRWMPAFMYDEPMSRHCHVGMFIPDSEIRRFLFNSNVDVQEVTAQIDAEQFTLLRALILVAAHFDLPGTSGFFVDLDTVSNDIMVQFDDAHALEKRMLVELISDDYLAIMGDGASDY